MKESESEIFLAIQDTTTLDYTHHRHKKKMKPIKHDKRYKKPLIGCLLHNTLLVSEKGLPVGLLDQKIFQHESLKDEHKNRPISKKESYRWLESLRKTKQLSEGKTVITVCDRESDIFEFLFEAQKLDANILIRADKDRILVKTEKDLYHTLWSYLKQMPLATIETIVVPEQYNRPERVALVELRFTTVTIKPPQRLPQAKEEKLLPVTLQAIWLYEPHPDKNTERLEWMLLTNLTVNHVEKALQMVRWYKIRWQVECYHRVLKSGCKIEDCRLETYTRLKRYLTLKSIVAFRLLWLTWINRVSPENKCDDILSEHEWKALYCYVKKTFIVPKTSPSVKEAIHMIAKLDGFLQRKNDGAPGMTYIWRGWEKLSSLAQLWLTINSRLA